MIENYVDLLQICLQTAVILAVFLLIFRNHIISIFDPLFFYLVTQAFSTELAIITIKSFPYLIDFIFCQLAFTVGFLLCAGRSLKNRVVTSDNFLAPNTFSLSTIKVFAVFVTLLIIVANVFLISKTGIALFADDPSAAKGENFAHGGGLGFIRRINWGVLYLCSLSLIYLLIFKKKVLYLILLLLLILILVLSGSKGVLLYFITLIPLLSKIKSVRQLSIFKWVQLSKYILLIGGILIALVIVSVGSEGTIDEAVFRLLSRFLFFGDAMLYYYDKFSVSHFAHYNFKDFIYSEANPILGFFRLVPYQRPLGFELVEYQLSFYEDSVFGPNVPFYVKGHIFFGPYGAVLYSFLVGGLIGFVRRLFYTMLEKPKGLIISLIIIHLNIIIYSFCQDSQLFIDVLFDTFFQAIPIYLIIYRVLKKGVLNTDSFTSLASDDSFEI